MSMVGFPLLLIPLAIYNIIVFLMPDVSLTAPLFTLTLMSGAQWPVTLSDMLLALGLLLLLLEIIKGARPGAKYLTDHLLSLIVFGAAAAEFVLWPRFGTSTYFLLASVSLVDFLSGVALRTRRRLQMVTSYVVEPTASKRATKKSEPLAESRIDPVVGMPAPAAATVAESVLPEHPEPQAPTPSAAAHESSVQEASVKGSSLTYPGLTAPPVIIVPPVTHEPSSEVISPGLQPAENGPPSSDKPSSHS